MAKRKSTGKRLRFEIFKRDGFTCQYCGQQPPDVVLVVDHINPIANGGDSDSLNLITACEACNQGKAARTLGDVAPRPDADLKWLEMQQEIAELRRYQEAKQERDLELLNVLGELEKAWCSQFGDWEGCPDDITMRQWLAFASPSEIEQAIGIASSHAYKLRSGHARISYTIGVLLRITGRMKDDYAEQNP